MATHRKTDFERAIERIRARTWSALIREWIAHIPDIDPCGSPPSERLDALYTFQIAAKQATDDSPYTQDVPGVRELLLGEGVYLLHKAAHVIGAAELHARRGMQTWSLSGAYHAALFAAKATMRFLGIGLPEYASKGVLVDICPELPTLSSKQRRAGLPRSPTIEFNRLGVRPENKHIWRILQRVINVSRIDPWPMECIAAIRRLDPGDFAWQRNSIHYNNCVWIHNDLHEFLVDESFGVPPTDLRKALEGSRDESDFSLILGLTLFKLGLILFDDIAANTNKLRAERELLHRTVTDTERHPIYTQAYGWS